MAEGREFEFEGWTEWAGTEPINRRKIAIDSQFDYE